MKKVEKVVELPFVGLRPFRQDESHLFFGREKQIVELMEKLSNTRFIGVIGSSGCGKSSIIKAGLIPKLKAGFLTEERDIWITASFNPADDPLDKFVIAVNNALSENSIDNSDWIMLNEKKVRELGITYILDHLTGFLSGKRINLLILVDQFEELFTIERINEEQLNEDILFVNLILMLSKLLDCPVYVITTMRSEYLGKCNKFYGLPEVLNSGQYLVPRLNRQQLRQVIELPIKLFGYKISARLVDILLNESDDKFEQLPVLQHCLLRTFIEWSNSNDEEIIDVEIYNRVGKFRDALSIHADSLYLELTPTQQKLTAIIFKSLSDINYEGEFVRRPQTIKQLNEILEAACIFDHADMVIVIEKFSAEPASFLQTTSKKFAYEELVDISHESLFKFWNRLSNWIREEAEGVRKLNWLANNVKEKRELLRGIDLKDALIWLKEYHPTIKWAERYHQYLPEILFYIKQSHKVEKNYTFLKRIGFSFALFLAAGIVLVVVVRNQENNKTIQDYKSLQFRKAKAFSLDQTFLSFYSDSCSKDKKRQDYRNYDRLKSLKQTACLYFIDSLAPRKDIAASEKAMYYEDFKTMNLSIHNFVKGNLAPFTDPHTPLFSMLMSEEAARAAENVSYGLKQLNLDKNNIKYIRDLSARYGNLSFRLLFVKKYKDAVKAGWSGLAIHPSNDWIYTDIALARLLDKKFVGADSIYHAFSDRLLTNRTKSFKQTFLEDFEILEKSAIITPDSVEVYAKVKQIKSYLQAVKAPE